jgi:phosphoribosyl 1,2-cyclic phosphodiesterase
MSFSVTFWGVRGSIATPGPETVEVGGNTSCVEVQCGERTLLLDTGTGMRQFGQKLLRERKRAQVSIFYSHLHWDHIQGLPFFTPLYMPGTELSFHGPKGLRDALATQMSEPGFPVRVADLPARLLYSELTEGAVVELPGDGGGDIRVTCAKLNHPGGVLAYRVEYGGRSVVYATDTEHYSCPDPKLVKLAAGADLLIYDAQYDDDEYAGRRGPPRTGWGHSTYSEGIRVADMAGVSRLALFHHDPGHSDAHVRGIEEAARRLRPGTFACREGRTVRVAGAQPEQHAAAGEIGTEPTGEIGTEPTGELARELGGETTGAPSGDGSPDAARVLARRVAA